MIRNVLYDIMKAGTLNKKEVSDNLLTWEKLDQLLDQLINAVVYN